MGEAHGWWALSDLNGRPFGCKPNALTAELSALTQFIVQEAARSVNAGRIFLFSLAGLSPMMREWPSGNATLPELCVDRFVLSRRGVFFSRFCGFPCTLLAQPVNS